MINVSFHSAMSKFLNFKRKSSIIESIDENYGNHVLQIQSDKGSVDLYMSFVDLHLLKESVNKLYEEAKETEEKLKQEKSEEEVNG